MGPRGRPETSAMNCHSILRSISEEHRTRLHVHAAEAWNHCVHIAYTLLSPQVYDRAFKYKFYSIDSAFQTREWISHLHWKLLMCTGCIIKFCAVSTQLTHFYRPTECGNNSTQRQKWGFVSHFPGTCHREPNINKIYTYLRVCWGYKRNMNNVFMMAEPRKQ